MNKNELTDHMIRLTGKPKTEVETALITRGLIVKVQGDEVDQALADIVSEQRIHQATNCDWAIGITTRVLTKTLYGTFDA